MNFKWNNTPEPPPAIYLCPFDYSSGSHQSTPFHDTIPLLIGLEFKNIFKAFYHHQLFYHQVFFKLSHFWIKLLFGVAGFVTFGVAARRAGVSFFRIICFMHSCSHHWPLRRLSYNCWKITSPCIRGC